MARGQSGRGRGRGPGKSNGTQGRSKAGAKAKGGSINRKELTKNLGSIKLIGTAKGTLNSRFTKIAKQAKTQKGKETGGKRANGNGKKPAKDSKATKKPSKEEKTETKPEDLDAELLAFKLQTPSGMDAALEEYKASATAEDQADENGNAATEGNDGGDEAEEAAA
eukprot:TRINITY_DN9312_c0_g1_i1.p1 TRINITY_DN9312_c0_g1~~TRINITY_DN9312_c0_g1_i1.p1  ORF type:complete len:166 (+),score=45.16 TRINITY_DN9312_c0_g1_i1:276-773(+)